MPPPPIGVTFSDKRRISDYNYVIDVALSGKLRSWADLALPFERQGVVGIGLLRCRLYGVGQHLAWLLKEEREFEREPHSDIAAAPPFSAALERLLPGHGVLARPGFRRERPSQAGSR